MAILAALAVTLAVALPGVSADGGEDKATPIARSSGTSGDNQAPPIPEKAALKYPNLGSHLDQLVASVETGQATAHDAASSSSLHSGGSVAVTIYLTGSVDEVVSFLEENGGDLRNVGEDYIEAYVPVSLLGPLSEQTRSRPGAGDRTAPEITTALNSPVKVWQEHLASQLGTPPGTRGQGMSRWAVIDTGFKGFSVLMGQELPTHCELVTMLHRASANTSKSSPHTGNLSEC